MGRGFSGFARIGKVRGQSAKSRTAPFPSLWSDPRKSAQSAFIRVPLSFLRRLLLQDLLGFLVGHLGDLVLVPLEERLDFLLAAVALVLGHLLGFLGLVEVLVAVTADIAAGHLGLLGRLPD